MGVTIYRWNDINTKFAEYGGAVEADEKKICWYDDLIGVPLVPLKDWKEPLLTQYLGEGPKLRKPKKIPDVVSSSFVNFISQNAADELSDIWEKHALLYPVHLDDKPEETYYMVVPQIRLKCLDYDRSVLRREWDGTPYLLKEWTMKEELVGDYDLFMVEYGRKYGMDIDCYVTERFRQRVLDAKLKGFCFASFFGDPKPFIS